MPTENTTLEIHYSEKQGRLTARNCPFCFKPMTIIDAHFWCLNEKCDYPQWDGVEDFHFALVAQGVYNGQADALIEAMGRAMVAAQQEVCTNPREYSVCDDCQALKGWPD